MRDGIIYLITNKINGKQYIGRTVQSIEYRFNRHVTDALSQTKGYNYPIANAIRKYGKDNFIIEELYKCNITSLNKKEVYYIEKYDTFNSGYNATLGGNGSYGFRHSEEIKQKMSEIKKGKIDGEKNPMYGKTHTDAAKEKISLAHKGKK